MTAKHIAMVEEIKSVYPIINFSLIKKRNSLQLLYDSRQMFDNYDDYLDTICDIAKKYLDTTEQNIFAVVYQGITNL